MAFIAKQITTSSSTAASILTTGNGFTAVAGNAGDPLPVIIKNIDAAITVYIGGTGVTAANGYPLAAGASLPLSIIGTGDLPFVIAASGSPVIAVLAGRQ